MLHGTVNIKLVDSETKQVVQEVQKNNLVTKGFEQFVTAESLCRLNVNWYANLAPLTSKGLGGLLMFGDNLTESSLMTGWHHKRLIGGGSKDNEGTNYRPNWKGKMTNTTLGGNTGSREWTFEKTRCNDTIKALALTNVSAFSEQEGGGSAFVFNDMKLPNDTQREILRFKGHTCYALPTSKGITFISAYMGNSTSAVLDTYSINDSISVGSQMNYATKIHSQSLLVTGYIDGVYTGDPINDYHKVRWNMYDDYHICGYTVQDGTLRYWIFDCTTLGADTTVEVGSIALPVLYSNAKRGILKDGYYYYEANAQLHEYDWIDVMVRLKISDGTYIHYLSQSNVSGFTKDLYMSINNGLLRGAQYNGDQPQFQYTYMQPEFWEAYQTVNGQYSECSNLTETESSVPNYSSYNTYDIMPVSRCNGYTPYVGAEKCAPNARKYDDGQELYSGITANRAFLGTVFNLPTPITKTDAQELVVEYTLTES